MSSIYESAAAVALKKAEEVLYCEKKSAHKALLDGAYRLLELHHKRCIK
jgi:hypothetical protein